MPLQPSSLEAIQTLALGFAFAGFLASSFELVTRHAAGLRLLERGGVPGLACVPVVVFSAPFLILRHTIRGGRERANPFGFAMLAMIAACLWSLACGRVVLDVALHIAGA